VRKVGRGDNGLVSNKIKKPDYPGPIIYLKKHYFFFSSGKVILLTAILAFYNFSIKNGSSS
jgi:hypothetical protein